MKAKITSTRTDAVLLLLGVAMSLVTMASAALNWGVR